MMAGFRFGLDPVLRQRAREEQEKQRAVAALERQRLEIESEIRGYQAGIESEREELAGRLADAHGGIDLGSVRLQANASLHLITLAQRGALRLAGVYERLDAARLELLEASMRRKAVEALRDERYAAWRSERTKKEMAALDEIAMAGFVRRARDGFDGPDGGGEGAA